MRIRSGRYGIYNGEEYRISKKRDGTIRVIIDDISTPIPLGFLVLKSPYGDKFYRVVQKEELEEVYKISTYVVYHGKKHYPAGNIIDGKIALAGTIDDVDNGFNIHSPGEYIKENVPLSDIEKFVEEKLPYDIENL